MSTLFRAALPVALFTLAGLATSASAQIVQDGDFESATSGAAGSTDLYSSGSGFDQKWVISGQVGVDTQNVYVFGGNQSLFLNSGIGTDSITQNVATDPTQFYTLSFYANDDTPGDLLNVSFGGTTLAPISVPANGYNGTNSTDFTLHTFPGLTTASAFSALSFSSVKSLSSGQLEIDNISLSSSPVPEASTSLSLGLMLLLGLGAAFAAKKKSASLSA